MFELRSQSTSEATRLHTAGQPLACFADYRAALTELNRYLDQLAAQLIANAEGASRIAVHHVIVETDSKPEAGWLWDTYRPSHRSDCRWLIQDT